MTLFNFKINPSELLLAIFNLAYITIFGSYYMAAQNYEFMWYIIVMLGCFLLVALTLHWTKFNFQILVGLSVLGLLHTMGGGIRVGEGVLYDVQIIPLFDAGHELAALKYDQIVHWFGVGVITLALYYLALPTITRKSDWRVVMLLIVLAGMGASIINEIVEFGAVLVLPETGVGGYENTLLDLTFNTLGALTALPLIRWHFARA